MASNKIEIDNSDQELKHLGFVRIIAINSLVCISNLYEYSKQNSGPLKSTVGIVESAVTSVVRPVYEKFKGVPGDLIIFLDKKVDEATYKFDEQAPPLAKQVVSKAESIVRKVLIVAQNVVQEAQVAGPRAAVHYAGALYKQWVLSHLATVWYQVNQIPPLAVVAQMAVPTAFYWSERYNKVILDMNAKGYTIFSNFPSVPIQEMAKAYKQVEVAKEGSSSRTEPKMD